jgi:hypothetical protein
MDVTTTATWTCPTCDRPRQEEYCGQCGERALHRHDLTLLGLVEQAVEAVAHVDGRVFRTFTLLMRRPGQLTAAYIRGQRKPLLGPLQVFLIANLVFFALQSAFHANVFSTPLQSQLTRQFYRATAVRMTDTRLGALHETQQEFAPAFDHAVAVNAKSLIILMTPPLALLTALLFARRGRPFVTHIVFAIHFYAFWLIAFCVVAPVLGLVLVVFMQASGVRLSSGQMDATVSWLLFGIAAAYLYLAARRVYAGGAFGRVLKVAALAVTTALTVIAYRFVVFAITLYTTTSH